MTVSMESAARDCSDLVQRFCLLADQPDADGVAALFTEDGIFNRGALRVQGREAIRDMVASRAPDLKTRHLITTSRIEPGEAGKASGRHYCLVFASGGSHSAAAPIVREYHDDYRLTAQGWKIAERKIFTPFEG